MPEQTTKEQTTREQTITQTMQYYSRDTARRRLVLIAVMSAIAVVSRSVFYMLPQVKPMAAVIMITGAAVGRRSGAATGALSALVSNFIFGQGPWTPWQMAAYALLGYLAGILFYNKKITDGHGRITFALFAGISVLVLYGVIMDTAAAVLAVHRLDYRVLLATYLSGLPLNGIHGGSTFVFSLLLTQPLAKKLYRVREKYGISTCIRSQIGVY